MLRRLFGHVCPGLRSAPKFCDRRWSLGGRDMEGLIQVRLLFSLVRARDGGCTRQEVSVKKLVSKRKKSFKAGEEDLEELSSDEDAMKNPRTPPRKEDGGTAEAVAMTSQMMEAAIGTQRDFFKGMTAGRCPHCSAHSPVLKREGYTKLFLMPLPPKKRAANAAQGTVR